MKPLPTVHERSGVGRTEVLRLRTSARTLEDVMKADARLLPYAQAG